MQRRSAILSEKPLFLGSRGPRKRRGRWVPALAGVPLLGMVAAFGIAPDTATERLTLHEVTQEIALPLRAAMGADDAPYWREDRVQRGDTIGSLLARLQVQDPGALNFLRTDRRARALYELVPGRPFRAVTTGDGQLLSMRYFKTDGTELVVRREQGTFSVTTEQPTTITQLEMASGQIQSSLFAAMDRAGLSDAVAIQLADIFSSEIDFHRDLQPRDRFSVVYEAVYANGELLRTGRIVAAEFINDGQRHRALYFEDGSGRGGYYSPDGKNVRKAFLRSPLEVSRISSGFSFARLHPVLNVWRAHKGVDYSAPVGTKVRVTADGVVDFVGRRGGYGKVIVVDHRNGYSTLYAHLSGFARDVIPGKRLEQGDMIGYVGMTGLATGPHLHYEFLVNGVHKDPLTQAMPEGSPITGMTRDAFERSTRPLLGRLDLVGGMSFGQSN
jgi:murein DD-endopeptidase MepM/ murein hydrolase activator NlpD